jgi:hypothetical protein
MSKPLKFFIGIISLTFIGWNDFSRLVHSGETAEIKTLYEKLGPLIDKLKYDRLGSKEEQSKENQEELERAKTEIQQSIQEINKKLQLEEQKDFLKSVVKSIEIIYKDLVHLEENITKYNELLIKLKEILTQDLIKDEMKKTDFVRSFIGLMNVMPLPNTNSFPRFLSDLQKILTNESIQERRKEKYIDFVILLNNKIAKGETTYFVSNIENVSYLLSSFLLLNIKIKTLLKTEIQREKFIELLSLFLDKVQGSQEENLHQNLKYLEKFLDLIYQSFRTFAKKLQDKAAKGNKECEEDKENFIEALVASMDHIIALTDETFQERLQQVSDAIRIFNYYLYTSKSFIKLSDNEFIRIKIFDKLIPLLKSTNQLDQNLLKDDTQGLIIFSTITPLFEMVKEKSEYDCSLLGLIFHYFFEYLYQIKVDEKKIEFINLVVGSIKTSESVYHIETRMVNIISQIVYFYEQNISPSETQESNTIQLKEGLFILRKQQEEEEERLKKLQEQQEKERLKKLQEEQEEEEEQRLEKLEREEKMEKLQNRLQNMKKIEDLEEKLERLNMLNKQKEEKDQNVFGNTKSLDEKEQSKKSSQNKMQVKNIVEKCAVVFLIVGVPSFAVYRFYRYSPSLGRLVTTQSQQTQPQNKTIEEPNYEFNYESNDNTQTFNREPFNYGESVN